MSRILTTRHIIELVKQHAGASFDSDLLSSLLDALFTKYYIFYDEGSYLDFESAKDDDGTSWIKAVHVTTPLVTKSLGCGGLVDIERYTVLTTVQGEAISTFGMKYCYGLKFYNIKPNTVYNASFNEGLGPTLTANVRITIEDAIAAVVEVLDKYSDSFEIDSSSIASTLLSYLSNAGKIAEATVEGVGCYNLINTASTTYMSIGLPSITIWDDLLNPYFELNAKDSTGKYYVNGMRSKADVPDSFMVTYTNKRPVIIGG